MKALICLLLALPTLLCASERSPYFEVHRSQNVDVFPLKSSHSKVSITGPIASVELTQTYRNEGDTSIDATYLFPASGGAAVHGMTMTIGERTIIAEIQEKQEARRTFEKAKQANQSASLLTQKKPNVFSMEVANVQPGDLVTLTLRYSEILKPHGSLYEFVAPTAIGPRYRGESSAPAAVTNPFFTGSKKTPARYSVDLSLKSPLLIKNLACPSHESAKIRFESGTEASLALPACPPDRDFIVRYTLAGDTIQSGLLLDHSSEENTFLLQIEPPQEVNPEDLPDREFIFVIDVSGSMSGFPLELTKDLFAKLAPTLRPTDRFNMLLFAGSQKTLSATSLPATPANISRGLSFLKRTSGGGSTRLVSALKQALSLPYDRDYARSLVLISDGFIEAEGDVFELIREKAEGTNIFPLGIGSSVNRHLMEGLSHFAGRDHFIVTHSSECDAAVERFHTLIAAPVLTNVKITSEGLTLSDLLPARQPDLFKGQPLSLIGKFSGTGRITLTGTTGGGRQIIRTFPVGDSGQNPELPTLWARTKVRALSDFAKLTEDPDVKNEVTQLGLKYQLLTPFTSFVAVSPEIRTPHGESVAVKQALPLPVGVSSQSIGSSGSVPEPSSSILLLVVGVISLTLRIRR